MDPFEVGNEGRIVIGAVKDNPDEVLNLLKGTEEGRDAEIIGETTADFKGLAMQIRVSGKRIVSKPMGDPIPRICRSTNAHTRQCT